MGQGKQAKILSPQQAAAALRHFETAHYPLRDQAMFLLSTKAGLRAKEIAELTWAMVTDGNGEIGAVIALENKASKGMGGWRMSAASVQRWGLSAVRHIPDSGRLSRAGRVK